MAVIEILNAAKILKKVLKLGSAKVKVTLDGKPMKRGDVDFHSFRFDLEAWRDNPKEYFCSEHSYFHLKRPQLTVNGEDRYRETADADLHGNRVTIEVKFCDSPDGKSAHELKFDFPWA